MSRRWFELGIAFFALLAVGFVLIAPHAAAVLAQEPAPDPEKKTEPVRVRVAPESQFSITVSENPSTGYTLALASMDKGIYLLRIDPLKSSAEPVPGAPSSRTFHFFHRHQSAAAQPPTITFARFQQFDFEASYQEDKYVLDIRAKPVKKPAR